MKKRWFSLLLALCMVLTLLPFGAAAAEIVDSGKCGENVSWSLDSSGVLTVFGTGEMENYLAKSAPFYGDHQVRKIVIDSGVTSVGNCAFYGCQASDVTLADSVERIGSDAFENCVNLKSPLIPEHVSYIGMQAFNGCSSIEYLLIPDSVEKIGNYAFANCTALKTAMIGGGVESLGNGAFQECDSLETILVAGNNNNYATANDILYNKSMTTLIKCPARKAGKVEIPQSVEIIMARAFQNCTALTDVTFSAGVKEIKGLAFSGCVKLTNVKLPDGLEKIGFIPFYGCTSLKAFSISENNTKFSAKTDGLLYSKNGAAVVLCPFGKTGSVQLSAGVTSIKDSAFDGCAGLTNVEIPEGVTSIGQSAFADCKGLTSVTIPSTVSFVWESAFQGCTGMKSLTIREGVKSIEEQAFQNCTALTSVVIPSSLHSMMDYAFAYCTALKKVTIENGLYTIENAAFAGCESLESVAIPTSVKKVEIYAFNNCDALKDVYYSGSEFQWNALTIEDYNDSLKNARVHFNWTDPIPDQPPTPVTPAPVTPAPVTPAPVTPAPVTPAPVTPTPVTPAPVTPTPVTPTPVTPAPVTPAPVTPAPVSPAPVSPAPAANPFTDVPKDQYYYAPVLWAVNHDPQITAGTSATTFSPNNPCTRGQIVTFLWRAKGCPEPTITKNPFTDVKSSDYFYKAVLWAVEKEITAGTSKTTFSPAATVTRAQTVTFLWRAEGKPAVQTKNPFTDVPAGQYYTDAVLWAVKNEITAGTSATTFSPANPCTRAQIVTFLYRDLAK